MSIKRKIATSLLFSLIFTLSLSVFVIYITLSDSLQKRIDEIYRNLYDTYRELLKKEEKSLKNLSMFSSGYYWQKISDEKCEEIPYYLPTASGLHYGVSRNFTEGCFFVGVNLDNILNFFKASMKLEWLVYYHGNALTEIKGINLNQFMKDKIVIGNIVVDSFSRQDIIRFPLEFKGYTVYGIFPEKYLLVEVPVFSVDGIPIGRIIFVKDVFPLYKEVYIFFIGFVLYFVFLASFIAYMLFRIISGVIDRIIFLKEITAGIEKKNFSVIYLLEKPEEEWEDELQELKRSIHNMALSLMLSFEELEKKKTELEGIAYYDPLTGLPNRRFFFFNARILLENAKRSSRPISVLVMDLDDFKKINDTYGHEAGDLVLKNFADVIRKSIRKSDLPARIGGEEFVVLMPNTNLEQSKVVAERIRNNLQNSLVVYKGKEIRVTMSGGLATAGPDTTKLEDLLRKADEALYRAKELGKNRVEVYQD